METSDAAQEIHMLNCFTQPMQGTRARPKRRVVQYRRFQVRVVRGPDAGKGIELGGRPLRVGTASDNDLVLSDETVSRQHCTLEAVAGGLRARDEDSTNGVRTNGGQIFDAILPQSSIDIWLGDTQLSVTSLEESLEKEQLEVNRYCGMLGQSSLMRELFADIERIAGTDVSVLVEGETGTGKELVTEAIHGRSSRADGPFVVFDCSAVAPTLAESELFGHVKGAFTGAVDSHPGVFEQANGGTIFLDELGELPKSLQPKLLRVLEKREVRRLGSTRAVRVDVRVVAATNRNLEEEIRRNNFREDLFYRIGAAHLVLPALRDRSGDLELLVTHFLTQMNPDLSGADVPQHIWQMFKTHRWPGNVRELRNAVQRMLVTPERLLPRGVCNETPSPQPEDFGAILPLPEARRRASDLFEVNYLKAVLTKTGGHVPRAAAIAEVSRQMVEKLLRKHGMTAGIGDTDEH